MRSKNPGSTRPRSIGSHVWAWTKRLVKLGLAALTLAVLAGVGTYFWFERDLPSVQELRTYRPPQVTKVFCRDGSLCAEFYRERRTWVQIESLPAHVKNAFLAAEDADFYKHPGLDFLGMARAAVKNLIPGRQRSGASTISQQACRNLLLSQERTLARKVREWILTPRMEKALSKDEILNLYVNTIYFGHNRYGVEEAALFYFGKRAKDLTVGEAAVLAGVPQLPDRINPVTNIVKAKKRQRYVLTQLHAHGFLPKPVVDAELERPIVLGPRPDPSFGAYYAEEVRKTLVARYGEEAVLAGGLRVDIAMDRKLQVAADEAVRAGLEALDRRQGFRGRLGYLPLERFAELKPLLAQRIAEAGKRKGDPSFIADLRRLAELTEETLADDEGAEKSTLPQLDLPDDTPASADEALVRSVALRPLREGLRVAGYVQAIDDTKKSATVDLVSRQGVLPFASASWARPRRDGKTGSAPTRLSEVLSPGDVVWVKVEKAADGTLELALDQVPVVQGALVVVEPSTRRVAAMVGGYDFAQSAFNRATQAKRQPGSAFKPFLYAAAIASQKYTSLTVVNDAPETIRDPYTGKTWKPQNYEKGGFEGPMTLRQALTKSKNTVSVRLIEALTPQAAIDFAAKAGVRSPMPDNLTLALGTGEVSVLELTNAYATLQSQGQFAEAIQIIRVTDAKGTVLEEHQAAFEAVLPPPVAFMGTSLMRSVVEEGTAVAVRDLGQPAAGKTGTAQEFRDAWFAGYTAHLVATAWVGFDNHDPLGPGETGGRAALPIWLSFMKAAHAELPSRDFEPPEGITLARIDPASGLLAGNSVPGRIEPFLEGTAPTTEVPPPGQVSPSDFFLNRGGL